MLLKERQGPMVDTVDEESHIILAPDPSDNLSDLDRLLVERDILVASIPLKGNQVDAKLAEVMAMERKDRVLAKALDRIHVETSVLDDSINLGILEGVATEKPITQIGAVDVHWQQKLPGVVAVYRPAEKRILMSGVQPDRAGMLISLAKDGTLPEAAQMLAHEALHARQDALAGGIPLKTLELFEAQAYVTSHGYPFDYTPVEIARFMEQANKTLEGTDIKKLDIPKFAYGLKAVNTLRALGHDIDSVVELFKDPGDWDPDRAVYTRLQEFVENSALQLEMDGDQLDEFTEAHRVSVQIDMFKARQITQEEMIKATPYQPKL